MNKKIQVTFEIDVARLPALQAFFSEARAGSATPTKTKPTAKKDEPEQLTVFDEPVKKITQTDIRVVAAKLVKSGKGSVLDALFKKFGATKLSDLAEEKYADFLTALEEIQ